MRASAQAKPSLSGRPPHDRPETRKRLHKFIRLLSHVLKDIDLTVEEGEFVVFVGPSGCGKSTLLRVIAGLEDATAGTDLPSAGDVVNSAPPPPRRGIAMVFQSYALYPHLSVRDNMSLGLKQEKQPKSVIEERVNKAVQMLDLGAYVDRRPSDLSAVSVSVLRSGVP